ncbi:MAG: MBL fold metallo-hydrolase RNA specificity domain-containing protein [Candidatus Zixiibacteriota bacterium]
MRLSFYGGTRRVTGSSHTIDVNGQRVLLDCGMFQGRRKEARKLNRNLLFDAESVNDVILGHAHIDHSGNLPNLYVNGFEGTIHATKATDDLCHYMLPDSAYLQERDASIVSRKHKRKGLPPVDPIYRIPDAMETIRMFKPHPYDQWIEIHDGFRFKFVEAGHILGSALILMEIKEDGKTKRIGYAVDLGRKNLPLLRDPYQFKDIDYLIMESTYGNRQHENIELAKTQLEAIIMKTINRGGKIIIPSFAVERTQEIIYHLHNLTYENVIPEIPIFVDSPLAVNVTDVFRKNQEILDEEYQKVLREQENPFGFDSLNYVRSVEESKELNRSNQPSIIISASGMCEGGRILHHLEHNIEDERNTILIVGFMAENTLGRKLVEGTDRVRIFGDVHKRKAEVKSAGSFSAHADQDELIEYAKNVIEHGRVKKIFLVHGEETASLELALSIKDLDFKEVYVPHAEDWVEL